MFSPKSSSAGLKTADQQKLCFVCSTISKLPQHKSTRELMDALQADKAVAPERTWSTLAGKPGELCGTFSNAFSYIDQRVEIAGFLP